LLRSSSERWIAHEVDDSLEVWGIDSGHCGDVVVVVERLYFELKNVFIKIQIKSLEFKKLRHGQQHRHHDRTHEQRHPHMRRAMQLQPDAEPAKRSAVRLHARGYGRETLMQSDRLLL
jgi:hypothetical protein